MAPRLFDVIHTSSFAIPCLFVFLFLVFEFFYFVWREGGRAAIVSSIQSYMHLHLRFSLTKILDLYSVKL